MGNNELTKQGMSKWVFWCCLLWLGSVLFGGCSPWRDAYFDGGVGELTQADIREKLGKPHVVKDPLLSDETTWTYRYALSESELDPSGIKTFGKQAGSVFGGKGGGPREKVYCYLYVLTFDKEGILRQWDRESCQLPKAPDPFQRELSSMMP
ncbi:MAG: hypothetical protein KC643_04140 [Nitrospira sp.]|nr:hypothetical protein [Nitrospira sp.]HQU29684.1 hypothetical protein [Nitrospirales bacterium]